MRTRARVLSFGSAILLVVAGAAVAIGFSGGLAQELALALIGLGLVLVCGLVFLEVGLSEDRERAREQQRHSAPAPASRPARAKPRLDRLRGNRRRLS